MKEWIPFGFALSSAKGLNSIQPQHLVDMRHGSCAKDKSRTLQQWSRIRSSIFGPLSWVEECRVVCALWLLQLYYVLGTKDGYLSAEDSHGKAENCGFLEASGPRFKDGSLTAWNAYRTG